MATFLDVVFEGWIYLDRQRYGIEAFQAESSQKCSFTPLIP